MEASSNKNPARPMCTRCRNHGHPFVRLKGHGKDCLYKNCTCGKCILILQRGGLNREKTKLNEQQITKRPVGRPPLKRSKKADVDSTSEMAHPQMSDPVGYKTKNKRKSTPRKLAGSTPFNYDMSTLSHPPMYYLPQDRLPTPPFQPMSPYGLPMSPESFARFPRFLPPRYPFENTNMFPTRPSCVPPLSPSMIIGRSFDRSDQGRLQELQVSPILCDQSRSNGNAISNHFMEASRSLAEAHLSFDNGIGGMGLRHLTQNPDSYQSQGNSDIMNMNLIHD